MRENVSGKVSVEPRPAPLGLTPSWRAQLEKVVTRLYLLPDSPKPQILVFLSTESAGNGRSVCAHCSHLLASRTSGPVCLLEANPQVRSIRQTLGMSAGKSLADLIANPELEVQSAATQVPGCNLFLVPGGLLLPRVALLSQSDRLADRMNELRMRFDFVLVDAPPLGGAGHALILAQVADGAILLLPASGAPRKSTISLKEEIEASGVTLLGAILMDQQADPSC